MRAAIVFLFVLVAGGLADEPARPRLVDDLLALVRERTQGRESCTRDERRVVIACDAMTFQVHGPDRTGRLQRAAPELGPNRDGVVLEVELSGRPYGGPMELPQRLRGPYYDTTCAEVQEGDHYLFVRARFGGDFPTDLRQRILAKLGAARTAAPPIRMWVKARADQARFKQGEPLLVSVSLHNGLSQPVGFTTFGTKPEGSNAETSSIDVVDIHRDGQARNLFHARPELAIPATVSGPVSLQVGPGGELRVQLDLAKWKIAGGWVPGTYDVTFRMRNIQVDERVTLAVSSGPVRLVID